MNTSKPKIIRKRLIPFEEVDISNDIILYRDENLLITKWNVIRARNDFSNGVSYTFLNDGFKIGRFYNDYKNLLFWYCDIIETHYEPCTDTYTLLDLLIDIKIMPDGSVKVIDLDEFAEAIEQKLITESQAINALRKTDMLLCKIYRGEFPFEVCLDTRYW